MKLYFGLMLIIFCQSSDWNDVLKELELAQIHVDERDGELDNNHNNNLLNIQPLIQPVNEYITYRL